MEKTLEDRRYMVVCINDKTGKATNLTNTPVSHKDGCTILSKQTPRPEYPHLRNCLKDVSEEWGNRFTEARTAFEAALSALDSLSPYRSSVAQYEAAVDRLAAAEQAC